MRGGHYYQCRSTSNLKSKLVTRHYTFFLHLARDAFCCFIYSHNPQDYKTANAQYMWVGKGEYFNSISKKLL